MPFGLMSSVVRKQLTIWHFYDALGDGQMQLFLRQLSGLSFYFLRSLAFVEVIKRKVSGEKSSSPVFKYANPESQNDQNDHSTWLEK